MGRTRQQAGARGARRRQQRAGSERASERLLGAQASGRGVAGERQARWARGLCAQAGPAGPGWSFIHSDLVFGPGLTRYFYFFSESLNEHCSL